MFRKRENLRIFQGLWAIFKYFSRQIWFSRTFQHSPSFSLFKTVRTLYKDGVPLTKFAMTIVSMTTSDMLVPIVNWSPLGGWPVLAS